MDSYNIELNKNDVDDIITCLQFSNAKMRDYLELFDSSDLISAIKFSIARYDMLIAYLKTFLVS